MNWDYISGFFDADGCITLAHIKKYGYKYVYVSFSNTKINILKDIQAFIKNNGISSSLTTILSKNIKHQTKYELKTSGHQAIHLIENITSLHSKKAFRISTVIKYYREVTSKNGRYNRRQESRKRAFERLFFIRK